MDDTKIPSERKVGQDLVLQGKSGILQRYIYKSQKWRIKCEDGTIVKHTDDELDFFECMTRIESILNDTCYIQIIDKILNIFDKVVGFDYTSDDSHYN